MLPDPDTYLDQVEERFATSTDFTIGLEEEFQILDPGSLALTGAFELLRDSAPPRLRERILGELLSSEIEIATPTCDSFGAGGARHRRAPPRPLCPRPRAGLRAGRHRHPRLLGLAGPAHHRHAALPRRRGQAQVRGLAQQHLEPAHPRRRPRHRPGDRRMRRDARLSAAPARAVGQLALHRGRLDAPALGAHADLRAHVPALRHPRHLRRLGRPAALLRGALRHRLHPGVHPGVVERAPALHATAPSRCASATCRPSPGRPWPSTSLAARARRHAGRHGRRGRPLPVRETRCIEENLWRAIRYGLDGKLVDWDHSREVPAPEALRELVEWVAPAGEALGLGGGLDDVERLLSRATARSVRVARSPGESPSTKCMPPRSPGPTRSSTTTGGDDDVRRGQSRRGGVA